MFLMRQLVICAALEFFVAMCVPAQNPVPAVPGAPQAQSANSASAVFQATLNDYWEYTLKTRPELATIFGDNRYNDQVTDWSPQFFASDVEKKREFLARFEAIKGALPAQEQLTKSLAERKLREDIEEAQFKPWEMPENQMYGPHLNYASMQHTMPFKTARDYENYIARLHKLPHLFDQIAEDMRLGIKDQLVQPQYLLEKIVAQAQGIGEKQGEASPFAKPLTKMPAEIAPQDQARIRSALLAVINNEVNPAYLKLARFVKDESVPKGRTEFGIWSLPNGDARYRFFVKKITTTNMTPEQIHQIGLREVERETAEWVRWYNHERIHSSIDYMTPIEREVVYADTVAQRGEVA